jgi:hypothetical protein
LPPQDPDAQAVFNETFVGSEIDQSRWVPWYLPHWSSRAAGTPRTGRCGNRLVLQIDHDQQPWCPEFDGQVRASVIQTGLFAGPVGSQLGQLRFIPECVVREAQKNRKPFVFTYGYVEIRCKAVRNPLNMCALWLMGYEEEPDECGEICLCELKGWLMDERQTTIGFGIKPWRDTMLPDDFREIAYPIDATDWHTYALDWRPGEVTYYLDGVEIGRSAASPAYPQQIMVGIYEFPTDAGEQDPDSAYPKVFPIEHVRVWQSTQGHSERQRCRFGDGQ